MAKCQLLDSMHPSIRCISLSLTLTDIEPSRFNLGAMLDATGKVERAVEEYGLAEKYGVERAKQNLRNARAKLLTSKTVGTTNKNNDSSDGSNDSTG